MSLFKVQTARAPFFTYLFFKYQSVSPVIDPAIMNHNSQKKKTTKLKIRFDYKIDDNEWASLNLCQNICKPIITNCLLLKNFIYIARLEITYLQPKSPTPGTMYLLSSNPPSISPVIILI